MRVFFKERSPGQIEFGIIYGGIALLLLCAAWFQPIFTFLPSCAFRGLTGIPCPTCGSTRSVVHLAHGDIASSLAMNPLISLCFLAAVPYFFYSIITLTPHIPRLDVSLTEQEKNTARAGVIMLVLINWTYLIFIL